MTDLILWRHGQTDYNSQGRIQGQVDIPLNETGRDQARRAADGIAALGPTRIVSSPLARARATAEVLASLTGLSVEIDEGLAEKSFGDWEGLKAADIKKQWPEHYATWRAGGELPQFRIEGRRQTAERVGEALKTIVAGSQKGDVIVAVSPGAATNLGATYLLGMDTQQWFGLRGMSNCCYALMRTNKRPPGWSVVKWNAGPPVDSSPLGKILG